MYTHKETLEREKKACMDEEALVDGECVDIEDKKKCQSEGRPTLAAS